MQPFMNAKLAPVPEKSRSRRRWVIDAIVVAVVITFLVVWSANAGAQEQAGSVEIAGAVEPVVSTALDKFAECVVKLKGAGVFLEKAEKSCKDVVIRVTRMAEGGWNSAQKAAQTSRPVLNTFGRGSWGSLGW